MFQCSKPQVGQRLPLAANLAINFESFVACQWIIWKGECFWCLVFFHRKNTPCISRPPGSFECQEANLGNDGSDSAPLIACQSEERDCYHQQSCDNQPLKGSIALVWIDTEDDLDPISPYQCDHQHNACHSCHARFKPETPSSWIPHWFTLAFRKSVLL